MKIPRSRLPLIPVLSVSVGLLAAGCTEELPSDPDDGSSGGAGYFPNVDSSSWNYSQQDYLNNIPHGDPQLIYYVFNGIGDISGETVQCYCEYISSDTGARNNVFYLRDNEINLVKLYAIETYDIGSGGTIVEEFETPWSYFPYPLRVGTSWQVVYGSDYPPFIIGLDNDIDMDGQSDTINLEIDCSVTAVEDVTTIGGYFPDCYKVKVVYYVDYYLTGGVSDSMEFEQYYWYRPGIGFVKYMGRKIGFPNGIQLDFSRELIAYDIKSRKTD